MLKVITFWQHMILTWTLRYLNISARPNTPVWEISACHTANTEGESISDRGCRVDS